MVSEDPADLANTPSHDAYLGLMERAFVPNIAHQHIGVLRKEPAGGRRQARARAER
jgi:hypothetical protein